MVTAGVRYVIVPGIDGSGPDHWQSHWEREFGPRASRIAPASWDRPDAADWLRALDAAVTEPSVLVAHSLGCLAVATWLTSDDEDVAGRVLGAFLVAPPDRAGPLFPATAATFTSPDAPLGVPAVLVASASDDPYSGPGRAAAQADSWRATFIDAGPVGHVNAAGGVGDWPDGRRLLAAFTAGLAPRTAAG